MIEAGQGFSVDYTALTLGVLAVAMVLEFLLPARAVEVSASRWLNNGFLALLTYATNHFFGTFVAIYILLHYAPPFSPGLSALPLWLDIPVTVLALEATRYGVHVAMHKVPVLWRLHAVHHADSDIDVTTSFRHHPLEAVLSAIPVTALVWVMDGAPQALVLYRVWDLVSTVFTHTNIKLPARLERYLRWIVVTPDFHRTHHMADRQYTDSNYSSTLPWFDYLFATYRPTTAGQQESEKIGLDTHTANEQRLDGMLLAPFLRREGARE